ncbi:lactate utilisation protein LutB domain-containing protein, partial [Congregibacter sp.]
LLRDLRRDKFTQGVTAKRWRFGIQIHAWLALHPRLYQRITSLAVNLMHRIGRSDGVIRKLPFAGGWLEARDLPTPAAKTFQQMHQESLQK